MRFGFKIYDIYLNFTFSTIVSLLDPGEITFDKFGIIYLVDANEILQLKLAQGNFSSALISGSASPGIFDLLSILL